MQEDALRPADRALLCQILTAQVESVREEQGEGGLMVLDVNGRRLAVDGKRVAALRRDDVVGRLAAATLRLKALSRPDHIAVAVVVAPTVTPTMADAARHFMSAYAAPTTWMLVGDDGSLAGNVDALGLREANPRAKRQRARGIVPRRSAQLFSDANCWLLKTLLLRDVDDKLWVGPQAHVESPTALARGAGVSSAHAHRFFATFRERDFLREADGNLTVVRRRALLSAWREANRQAHRRIVPVRWALGTPTHLDEVFEQKRHGETFAKDRGIVADDDTRAPYAVTGFEACRILGTLHVAGIDARPEVYVDMTLAQALDTWDLDPCEPHAAHLFLIEARGKRSIFDGRVERGGTLVVDILQAALDADVHPARGPEQAEYIFHHVLNWMDV